MAKHKRVRKRSIQLLVPLAFVGGSNRSIIPVIGFCNVRGSRLLVTRSRLSVPTNDVGLGASNKRNNRGNLHSVAPRVNGSFRHLHINVKRPKRGSGIDKRILSGTSPSRRVTVSDTLDTTFRTLPLLLDNSVRGTHSRVGDFGNPRW